MATKIGKIVGNSLMILIFIIGIYTFVAILMGGETGEEGEVVYNETAVSLGLNSSMWIIGLGLALALVFGLIRLIVDFKRNAKIIVSIAIFAILCLIVYLTSSDMLHVKTVNFLAQNGSEPNEIASTALNVDFGLKLTVTLIFIAVISIVVGWAVSLVKRLG